MDIEATSARTPEDWQTIQEAASQEFVISILGMGDVKRTPVEDAEHLFDTLWEAYIEWTEAAGRDADVSLRA